MLLFSPDIALGLDYAETVSKSRLGLLSSGVTQGLATTRRAAILFVTALTLHIARLAFAQDAQERPDGDYEFVSGVIAAVTRDRITVRRTVSGRTPENHTFLINGETRVEGNLQPRARVTVGYRRTEQGDVAVRIIVREEERSRRRKD